MSSSRLCSSKTASIRRVSWHAFFQISTIGWGMISVRVTGGACHENDIFCVTAFPHWLCDLRQPRCSACSRGANVHFVGSPVVQSADQHSATIVWNTNAPSSSRVMYGTNTNNLNQLAEAPYGGAKHEVKINNLQPGTTYYFQAESNEADSCGVRSFSTPAVGQPAGRADLCR